MEKYKEGDLILCTVDKIEGTTVSVYLPNNEKGAIITSEIAAGRIRNIRDYVRPHKKIVCKVLRVLKDHLDLSLRRVNAKEKKEIMQLYKQEQTSKSALHSILKQDAEKAEEKILKDFSSLFEFLTSARENEKLIDKYIPKQYQEAIKKITQKKQKDVEIKKILKLKCLEDDGIKRIKKILTIKDAKIKVNYLTAGKFQITIKSENYKQANQELDKILQDIEKDSKSNKCDFEVSEKK